MEKLFLDILHMSITSCYVIIFVILFRLVIKKLPKIYSYILWAVVLFRLVCPFSLESIFSLIPKSVQTVSHDVVYNGVINLGNSIVSKQYVLSSTIPADPMIPSWITMGSIIWILGIAALLLYSIFTTWKFYRTLDLAIPVYDNIYQLAGIETPFVFGFIKPKIYLPFYLNDQEREYIIKHEQIHIKRYDYIIKPVAFMILCIHWFNPLVWLSFLLMSKDMELSCDEAVLKSKGSDIKKDYSASLLYLSTKGHIFSNGPLAFGENNVKARISNILKYKKPTIFVVIVSIVLVIAVGAGLMFDKKESTTVRGYAENFISKHVETLNNSINIASDDNKIVDSKITKLENIATFDNMMKESVELWRLEYRLKPSGNVDAYLIGGVQEIDGWLNQSTSMGSPLLVIGYKHGVPYYIGNTWDGESDISTIAGQETLVRSFLEGMNLIDKETFPGNHIMIEFPLSTGETSKLLLSQPVTKGDAGIWCVERWIDGTGNLYYITPQTMLSNVIFGRLL